MTENANAHIGGKEMDDFDGEVTKLDQKKDHLKMAEEYSRLFEDTIVNSELNDGMVTFYDVIDACAVFKEKVYE